MAELYANRGFISINNQQLVDVRRITLKLNRSAKAVPTMSVDGFNTGFTIGNWDIDITFALAVEQLLTRPKLEFVDWSSVNGQLTTFFGADQFTCTGLFWKDSEEDAPEVGTEVTCTYNMGALKIIDAVGQSSLFKLAS